MDSEKNVLVKQRTKEIADKYIEIGQVPLNSEVTAALAHEYVLKEVSATLTYQKRLHSHVNKLETENVQLEKTIEERKMVPPVPIATVKPQAVAKISRKVREHRSRSQEWPDVPDVGKIEEQNPEILAQKILETGRQIEAGKLNNIKSHSHLNGYNKDPNKLNDFKITKQSSAVPAVRTQIRHSSNVNKQPAIRMQKPLNVIEKVQESPKVINFEDRLKSIITSVLNEDQEQRKAAQAGTHGFALNPHTQQQSSKISNSTAYGQQSNYGSIHHHSSQHSPTDVKPVIQELKHSMSDRYTESVRNSETFNRLMENRSTDHRGEVIRHGDRLVDLYRVHGESLNQRELSPNGRTVIQPDYTQVSPAKLALRRHLSQEKLSQHHPSTIVATRTIGDLVNGEIERTLEISNQSIINAAVNMSSKFTTPSNMMNSNIPPRPERVNVRVDTNHEPLRQAYSPISRPNSTDGGDSLSSNTHSSKSPQTVISSNVSSKDSYSAASPHSRPTSSSEHYVAPCTVVLYQSKGSYSSHQNNPQYVPLPRAEIKPFHGSYFNETKPTITETAAAPLEGLAASLQARILASDYWKVKEEDHSQYPNSEESVQSVQSQPTSVIKTEICEKSPSLCQFNENSGQKRMSPVIQKSHQSSKKPHLELPLSESFPLSMPSPEPHSNTSTPLVDEIPERERSLRPDEGTS